MLKLKRVVWLLGADDLKSSLHHDRPAKMRTWYQKWIVLVGPPCPANSHRVVGVVSSLGVEGGQKKLWTSCCQAKDVVDQQTQIASFLFFWIRLIVLVIYAKAQQQRVVKMSFRILKRGQNTKWLRFVFFTAVIIYEKWNCAVTGGKRVIIEKQSHFLTTTT